MSQEDLYRQQPLPSLTTVGGDVRERTPVNSERSRRVGCVRVLSVHGLWWPFFTTTTTRFARQRPPFAVSNGLCTTLTYPATHARADSNSGKGIYCASSRVYIARVVLQCSFHLYPAMFTQKNKLVVLPWVIFFFKGVFFPGKDVGD